MNFFGILGMVCFTLLLGVQFGVTIQQKIYNPEIFEDRVLELSLQSYRFGCNEAQGKDCEVKARKHYDDIKKILKKKIYNQGE